MKTVCIHQPDFAPWLGFFDRLIDADVYVVFDDAQFLRRGWHHRDKILGPQGTQWLTVPVLKKGRYHQEIRDVKIDESTNWRRKHLQTLASVYGNRPGFESTHRQITEIYDRQHERLIDLNMDLISWLLKALDIEVQICMSSEFGIESTSTSRLVELTQALGGTTYISGLGAKNYLDEEAFRQQNIEVRWQEFLHPTWDQGQSTFLSMLSTLDTLYQGATQTKMLSREGQDEN